MIERQTTKDIIIASLRELTKTRSIDDISVSDIIENCGISRRTFYNHFRDKQALVLASAYDDPWQVAKNAEFDGDFYSWAIVTTRPWAENLDWAQRFGRENIRDNNFLRENTERFVESLLPYLKREFGLDPLPEELRFHLWHYLYFYNYASTLWFLENRGDYRLFVRWAVDFMPETLRPYLQRVPLPEN